MNSNSLGIVVITHNEPDVKRTLDRLAEQKKPGDFIVLVDNHRDRPLVEMARRHPAVDKVLTADNPGFTGGCNLAVENIPKHIPLILLHNPDAYAEDNALEIMRHGKVEWAAWMGLLVMPNGLVNSASNIVHISGLSWCEGYNQKAELFSLEREVHFLSGANLVIRRQAWDEIGGFGDYINYYEDTDLSMMLILRGYKQGILPKARFIHDYDYVSAPRKWFFLERNRYIFILRTWPTAVILVLLPFLVVTEVGLWGVAVLQRRFASKVKATVSMFKALPATFRERKEIQRNRKISSHELFSILEPEISTPLLGGMRVFNGPFKLYYGLAGIILKLFK